MYRVSFKHIHIMSYTFTLNSTNHILEGKYFPPIDVSNGNYCLALIGLYTYNTIPNIDEGCNKFYYDKNKVIIIPTGSYEISDIEKYLQEKMANNKVKKDDVLILRPNNNTIKCELMCKYAVNFEKDDSIGKLLGFSSKSLPANSLHSSDLPVSIIKVTSIRVECNIVTGAFYNSRLSHTLFEFSPQVNPGYALVIEPRNHIYLPINVKNITNIIIHLLDQNGKPVNFRGENITIRLELKKYGDNI